MHTSTATQNTYPRPVFASIGEVAVGMVVLTHSGRTLKVTHVDQRREVVHYREERAHFAGERESVWAGFSTFASVVASVTR